MLLGWNGVEIREVHFPFPKIWVHSIFPRVICSRTQQTIAGFHPAKLTFHLIYGGIIPVIRPLPNLSKPTTRGACDPGSARSAPWAGALRPAPDRALPLCFGYPFAMRPLHSGIQTLSDDCVRLHPYLCLNETRPETRTMATIYPTQAEINEIERRAHVLRAEAFGAAFAAIGGFIKSTASRLNPRKPNLVRTFLEA